MIFNNLRWMVIGIDYNWLSLLMVVLEKKENYLL